MEGACHYCGGAFAAPPLDVDMNRNAIIVDGLDIKVFPRQAEVFSILLDAYPKCVSPDRIAAGIWGAGEGPEDEYTNIKVQICQLRKTLLDTAWAVHVVRGVGYHLAAREK